MEYGFQVTPSDTAKVEGLVDSNFYGLPGVKAVTTSARETDEVYVSIVRDGETIEIQRIQ